MKLFSDTAMERVKLYDTTLRDGMQAEGVSFSLADKLLIAKRLDEFGLDYIEGGYPMSNPKEAQFFKEVTELDFENAKIVAFGSTRRSNITPAKCAIIQCLVKTKAEVITIFGKSWDLHVKDVIRTSLKENLAMIEDSVHYLKSKCSEVVYDAEHFFDGYLANPEYALETLKAAERGGADIIVLCDTNDHLHGYI